MTSKRFTLLLIGLFFSLTTRTACAHLVHYDLQNKGVTARIFYGADDPASYSPYELYGPGDVEPHATGRTDRNGLVSFFPDRAGEWKIKVLGESAHGSHGVGIEVKIDRALDLESFRKPPALEHTKIITGISLIFGLFGLYAFFRSRKKGPLKPVTANYIKQEEP